MASWIAEYNKYRCPYCGKINGCADEEKTEIKCRKCGVDFPKLGANIDDEEIEEDDS